MTGINTAAKHHQLPVAFVLGERYPEISNVVVTYIPIINENVLLLTLKNGYIRAKQNINQNHPPNFVKSDDVQFHVK